MKYGINIIEGFKMYQLNERLSEHPVFWIFDEEAKKYYFFPLTSVKEEIFNENLLCFGNGDYERDKVFALNVNVNGKTHFKYGMYMVCACAVVDEKFVSSKSNINSDAAIRINQKYCCSNGFDLRNQCLELIYDKSYQVVCYDGNVDYFLNCSNKKFEDDELPQNIFNFIMDIVDPE